MLKLYHAPGTRAFRIHWLLEELGVPYELETVHFAPSATPFSQRDVPFGKLPAIEDGELTMCESGAILEYVLERYGGGRLAPAPGTAARGRFLQWVHFAEATGMPPIGEIVRQTMLKPEGERIPALVAEAHSRTAAVLRVLEEALAGREYLLGDEFSAADIMMGYTLLLARAYGALTEAYPALGRYLARLEARPAFQEALRS